AQFELADKDKNGYLDKKEAEASRFFRGQFEAMDRDGDGMLYLKEVLAFLEQMKKFREMVVRGCTSLVLRDEGKGLFDLLDTDGDGRLSVRELRNAAKVLLKLDQDQDGALSPTEVPRSYLGTFEQGPSGVEPVGRVFAIKLAGDFGGPARPERT